MSEAPDGWGAGLWRLDGHSEEPGWLLLPAHLDDVEKWVEDRLAELRSAWGSEWRDAQAGDVRTLLRHGIRSRPADAALAFQLWPVPAPLVAHVQASFGRAPEDGRPDARDGVRYDAAGLGVGVEAVRRWRDEPTGVEFVGVDIAFVAEEAAVVVSFEPTIPELFGMLAGQFHAFVQSLRFSSPDGRPVVSGAPSGFVDDARWSAEVPVA